MKTFYRASAAAIIVYDITKEETFEGLDKEMQIMSTYFLTQRTTPKRT
jgi:GTPase SAR1 family protein